MLSFMRIGSWTISNLCDGQPRPMLDATSVDVSVVVPILSELLHCDDCEIISHTRSVRSTTQLHMFTNAYRVTHYRINLVKRHL